MFEDRLVMLHRFDGLPMLIGVVQDRVARHDAAVDFIEHHLATELHKSTAFVAGDRSRVWLKEAQHLLLRRDFFCPPGPGCGFAQSPASPEAPSARRSRSASGTGVSAPPLSLRLCAA